jgi:hypothetical protein
MVSMTLPPCLVNGHYAPMIARRKEVFGQLLSLSARRDASIDTVRSSLLSALHAEFSAVDREQGNRGAGVKPQQVHHACEPVILRDP